MFPNVYYISQINPLFNSEELKFYNNGHLFWFKFNIRKYFCSTDLFLTQLFFIEYVMLTALKSCHFGVRDTTVPNRGSAVLIRRTG